MSLRLDKVASVTPQLALRIGGHGDSITQQCCSGIGLTAGQLTSAGGLMNISVSGFYGLPGYPFYIINCPNDEYNGLWTMGAGTNGTNLIANVAFPGSATPTPGVTLNGSSTTVVIPYISVDYDWLGWACQLSGGAIRRGIPYGHSGQKAAYCLNNISKSFAAGPSDVMTELSGTNDARQMVDTTPAGALLLAQTIFTVRKQAWDAILAAGRVPLVCTLPPLGSASAGWIANAAVFIRILNAMIREFCAKNKDYILVDFYKRLIDPLDANGNWLPNLSADGVHPIGPGAYLMGDELYKSMLNAGLLVYPPNLAPSSVGDSYGVSSAALQLLDNPLGVTTGVAATPPATGTCLGNWTLTYSGAGTCAGSTPASADGIGNNQLASVTPTGADTVQWNSIQYSNRLVGGETIFAACQVAIAGMINLKNFEFDLNLISSGLNALVSTGRAAGNVINNADKTVWLITPVIYVPAASDFSLSLRAWFSAGQAACTVKILRTAVWKIIS